MSKADALMEAVTQELVAFLIEDNDMEIDAAMNLLYGSALFDKLQDPETGLYLEGSAYVYELLRDELVRGPGYSVEQFRQHMREAIARGSELSADNHQGG